MFSSQSKLLKQNKVKKAVMTHANVAQCAFEFDSVHVKVDKKPHDTLLKQLKLKQKLQLMSLLNEYKVEYIP